MKMICGLGLYLCINETKLTWIMRSYATVDNDEEGTQIYGLPRLVNRAIYRWNRRLHDQADHKEVTHFIQALRWQTVKKVAANSGTNGSA